MQDEREPVRLPLDTRAVQNWLSAHGQAFKDVRVLAQFGAGQSNPTYLLQACRAHSNPTPDHTPAGATLTLALSPTYQPAAVHRGRRRSDEARAAAEASG